MPYVDIQAYKTDGFTGITNGGEWSGSTNATGNNNEIEVSTVWFSNSSLKNLDIKSIDSVVFYLYPKCSRSGSYYATNLRWFSKVGGIEWYPANNSSRYSWIEVSTNFPTSYPSTPWALKQGSWTVDHAKNYDLLLSLKVIADSNALKQTAYIKGLYCRVTYTLNTYTISVASNGNGTVSGGGSGLTKGATTTITATPASGYAFAYWSDGNRNATRTVTVSGNATYTATFVKVPTTERATYIQDGSAGYYVYAYIQEQGNGIGRVQFPTWTSANGQDDLLAGWQTNSAVSGEPGSWTINNLTYNYRYYVKVSDHNNEYVGYNTHIYPYDETGNQGTTSGISMNMLFTISVNAQPTNGGVVTGATTISYGSLNAISATPNYGYYFSHWSDGNVEPSRVITVTQDITYTAIFEPITVSSLDISHTELTIKINENITPIHDYILTLYQNNVDCSVSNGSYDIQPNYLMLNAENDDCYTNSFQMSSMNDTIKKYVFEVLPNQEYTYTMNAKVSEGTSAQMFVFYYDNNYNYITHNASNSTTEPSQFYSWTTPNNAAYASIRVDNNVAGYKVYFTNIFVYEGKVESLYNTAYLGQIIEPINALNKLALWTSSNPEVAIIDEDTGKITAKSVGTTTITCQARGDTSKKMYCTITVKKDIDDGPKIYLGTTPLKIYIGEYQIQGFNLH